MTSIHFAGQRISCEDESVLTALLARGHQIPYSCQQGVCQSCLMVCAQGELPAEATAGLSQSQKQRGLFLSCSCRPHTELWVERYDPRADTLPARVVDKQMLPGQVLKLTLCAEIHFRAGQAMTLWRNNDIARCYSTTRPPTPDNTLEFHIRVLPDGAFSRWAADTLAVGDTLPLQGPLGEFYYRPQDSHQPLLLAGVGTGLAPLYAIAWDALGREHQGPIVLLAGSRRYDDFYYLPELTALAREHPQVEVHLLTPDTNAQRPAQTADIYQFVRNNFAELRAWQIYIAGAPHFVQKMRKTCFMAGASGRQIFTDSFTH